MYNQYKKIKKSKKNNRIVIKPIYILIVLIVIIGSMSMGYSHWTKTLKISGKVTAKSPSLPVAVLQAVDPEDKEDDEENDGILRYTSITNLRVLGIRIYKVSQEEYDGKTVTTTIKHNYKQYTSWAYLKPTITLSIKNDTNTDFTNGKIELQESRDDNGIFKDVKYSVTPTFLPAGEEAKICVNGTLRGNYDIAPNTHYNFVISYDVGEETRYFYYNINIIP